MTLSFVLVLPIKLFHLGVFHKGVVHILAALHIQLQVHVALLASALVLDIDALHKVEGVALKQVADGPLHLGVLHQQSKQSTSKPPHASSHSRRCPHQAEPAQLAHHKHS